MLVGVITTRHIVLHSRLIVREFGWHGWARCVRASVSCTPRTFLSVIW
jgi:hypothetical protein